MVTKEALNNAVKHSEAKNIIFSMEATSGHIRFTLKDDGKGFIKKNESVSHSGRKNGLDNMAWRMQQAGGTFNIDSQNNKGTVITYGVSL
jgi:signal transduction histidine kinase